MNSTATEAAESRWSSWPLLVLPILALLSSLLMGLNKRSHPPGPKRWPLVGSYFEVVKNFPVLHDWILKYFTSDCRTIAIDFGTSFNLLTVDPANVEYILKTNFSNYPKGEVVHVKNYELMGDGIFNSDGATWKRHRRVASYEFSSRKVNDFSSKVYKKYAVRLLELLDTFASSQQAFDFQDICMRMTLDSICEIAFGVEMNFLSPSLHDVPFATSFDRANELLVRRSIGPVWKLLRALNLGTEDELKKHVAVLDSFTFKVIQNRRREIEEHTKTGKHHEKQDLLSRFMAATTDAVEEKGIAAQDKELRDAILNFIIAGRDTTAITLSWFVYCICKTPHVVDKIRSELDEVLGADRSLSFSQFAELLTSDNLRKLHYLQAAASETLRLYPAVPRDGKSAANDDVLPDGTSVKKGDAVVYVPYAMGRMEFLWGPDALEFKPERWIKDGEYQPESPFKYTAFQAGPRVCLGKDTAYLQIKITAAILVRYLDFKLVENQVIHYRMLMVLAMLNGIKVTVTRV